MRIVGVAIAGSLLLAPGIGQAAEAVPPALLACAGKADDAERLACYDAAVSGLSAEARRVSAAREAEAAKQREVAAAAAAASAAAAARAAEEAKLAGFGRQAAERAGEVESIDASVREILSDSSGKPVFILDNEQMWRQADGFRLPNVRAGTAVEIRRGALGSYRLAPKGSNRSVQVIRMR